MIQLAVKHRALNLFFCFTICEMVDENSRIITDEWKAYKGNGKEFIGGHETIEHAKDEYVRGDIYTNTAESYFCLINRGVYGAFHHVSKQPLHRYCNEFTFRWNNRQVKDGQRTIKAIKGADNKRLRYKMVSRFRSPYYFGGLGFPLRFPVNV